MNYQLNKPPGKVKLSFFWQFLRHEKLPMFVALSAILISSLFQLAAPTVMGHALDTYILVGDESGLLKIALQLLVLFVGSFVASYIQTIAMGGVGQRLLFNLRNAIFTKVDSMPMAFFNQNKAGDLISRINNDTEKLNQFFSEAIMRFVGNAFMIAGAGISLVAIDVRLGVVALLPAAALLIIAKASGGYIKRKNAASLQTTGNFSAAVQENLENFKVMIVFNRQDYFRERLAGVNEDNYQATKQSELANSAFTPLYTFMGQAAQLIAITYGISLVLSGSLTIGLLISFLTYITRFYDPLRQVASFWGSLQAALSAGDRIQHLLTLPTYMTVTADAHTHENLGLVSFKDVTFAYPDGKTVLSDINLTLEPGKTYAFVGPTGGGKTTSASLIARLYDPTEGTVYLSGRDIRSYTDAERAQKIGFILQDPFLLQGTIRENILYGNTRFDHLSDTELMDELARLGLSELVTRFENGLKTEVGSVGGTASAGQKQIVAFIRAILRAPELLILDEATANIDTVTEKLLDQALEALPKATAKVIIAHRLNTIANADEIFFVNGGEITPAGSLEHAMDMLLHKARQS
ncbi:MAG: ATP-binding cassette, subfamily bacterial [Patescibacteria group bacterium]|nr:ATP-binding cassette, subfamily bacterial [Patescibacteria group bacterium]